MAGTHAGFARRRVHRLRGGVVECVEDVVAEEVPIALVYNGRPHVVMMATPCDLHDFALGFSLTEAVIGAAEELESIEVQALLEGIEIRMRIPQACADALEARRRNLTGRTSCGLCGAQALEDALRLPPRVKSDLCIDAAALSKALAALHERQPLNQATGATHAAAWANADGTLAQVREDVGRHNALDKLVGALARENADFTAGFLVVTSRASYEMAQKAATVGVGVLAAISAPTALAIQLATQANLGLVGFARGGNCVVYAVPGRIAQLGRESSP